MITIGIDPGLSGACAVLDHNGLRVVFDLPTMQIPNVGTVALVQRKVDGLALAGLLRQHIPPGEPVTAAVEAVSAMGGKNNSIQTQGSLMRTLGAIEAVLECFRYPVVYAYPQIWKKFYGLIDPNAKDSQRKGASLAKARALYPGCTDIARAKDNNRAEAILIAHWHMRTTE